MQSITNYIKHPRFLGKSLLYRFGSRLSDSLYLRLLYYFQMGKKLDLKHPKTFNEKLQWLKLYDHRPEYATMVDKYAVKDYVANIIGQEYIIPTLGVWDRPEDIAWDELPRQFVLKATHGGGSKGVVICKDKLNFDKEKAIADLNKAMKRSLYQRFREWPYKNVPKRILGEVYMEDFKTHALNDYKFFCFNGIPSICGVFSGRWSSVTSDYFDMEWSHLPFTIRNIPFADSVPPKPLSFDTMRQLAAKLAAGYPHLRVDFYEVNSKVYFGELTFFSASGFSQFSPQRYDEILGDKIILPSHK